jgi:hypothetical protein
MEEIPIRGIVVGGVHFGLAALYWLEMDELGCIWTVGGFTGHSFCMFSSHCRSLRETTIPPFCQSFASPSCFSELLIYVLFSFTAISTGRPLTVWFYSAGQIRARETEAYTRWGLLCSLVASFLIDLRIMMVWMGWME